MRIRTRRPFLQKYCWLPVVMLFILPACGAAAPTPDQPAVIFATITPEIFSPLAPVKLMWPMPSFGKQMMSTVQSWAGYRPVLSSPLSPAREIG